jgi:hypothetical protein
VASYDAQINLIIGGVRQLRELEDRLNGIQNTIEEINDLGANAVMGRNIDMSGYARVLRNLEAIRASTNAQAGEQQRANALVRDQLLLYSQLNREQNLYRRRSSAFTEESRGVRETNQQVIELTTQLRTAQRAFSQLFAEGDIQGVRTINAEIGSLLEELREINRVATGTKNVGANTAQLQSQADAWQIQINALRQRAGLLSENEEILARLLTAERNLIQLRNVDMTFRDDANVRLGRQELENAKLLLKAEEDIATRRDRDARAYQAQIEQQTRQIQQQAKELRSVLFSAGKLAGKAGSAALDALTFGRGSQIAKGAKNAAIRGGIGLGALGLGGAYTAVEGALGNVDLGILQGPATQAANAVGGAINNALGGIPEIVGNLLSALGDIPGALGLASVAALAFAPAMKTAGEAVFEAGKKFGSTKFGENVKLTLERQTNLFESVINAASEMNMTLDASKSGLNAVGAAIKSLPALPAAGQTSFRGEVRRGRSGAFIGGGARDLLSNPDYLVGAAGIIAERTQDAADTSLRFAEGLGQAAVEAKTVADYLSEAVKLQKTSETSAQRFVRQTIEKGRAILENQRSADIARERSAQFLGGQYSLAQVPPRGELLPGGRTETRQPDYREMLNQAAQARAVIEDSLNSLRSRAIQSLGLSKAVIDAMTEEQRIALANEQIQKRSLGSVSEAVAARRTSLGVMRQEQVTLASINAENERSVEIIRQRNRELRATPVAAMTPQERVGQGIFDPATLRADRRRRVAAGRARQEAIGRATSEGLIGGAFPLLFGQGVGASLGGLAGGIGGGLAGGGLGFGLSLIGTALGTAIDTLGAKATEVGKSLRYPAEAFEKLKEAGLLASRQQEYYIAKLIESGRIVEANGEIQKEIIKKVGVSGVKDLAALGDSSTKLSKVWAEFNLQLQAAIAGPLAGLLDWVSNILAVGNEVTREAARQQQILDSLSPENKKALLGEQSQIQQGMTLFNEAQKNKQISELYTRYQPLGAAPAIQPGALTPEQRDAVAQAQAQTRQLQAQVELAAKRLSLTGLTLERDGARYIQASKSIALQEYENKLLEIKDGWIGKVFDKEKNIAMIRAANLEYAAKLKQIEAEVAEAARARASALYQAEIQYYQEVEKRLDLAAREEEVANGQQAGIKRQIELSETLRATREQILLREETLALVEARKNGTEQQVRATFELRFASLRREFALNEKILKQREAEYRFDRMMSIEQAKNQAAQPFIQFRQDQELSIQYAKTYHRLLTEGVAPTEAKRIADFERMVAQQKNSLDLQILIATAAVTQAESYGVSVDKIAELRLELERLNKAREETDKYAQQGPGEKPKDIPGAKIQEFISEATAQLNDLESVAIRVSQSIGDAIGNSLANGISGLIEGTTTAKQIFADFLKSVGQILVQEGTKMIATYIAIGIAKMFAGLFTAGSSSASAIPSSGIPSAPTINGFDTGAFANIAANGAYFSGGASYFANGGVFTNKIVSSPTLFKFADGGSMNTGVMGEAGPEAIMPLRRGASGRLGVDASGLREAMGSAPGASSGSSVLNMTFETTSINGVEYVSREQLESAMAATRRQAASDGAKRGMSMALDKLQQSPQARRRIGI